MLGTRLYAGSCGGPQMNRPKRLFSKNTGVCQAAQGAVYALTPARCRKVKGRG